MSIVNVRDFCEAAQIDEDNISSSLAARVISAAQKRCEYHCRGREFELADHDEYHDVLDNSTPFIYVRNPPLNSVSALTHDSQADSPDTIASTDYFTDAEMGRLELKDDETYFVTGDGSVRIQYSGGYAESDMPDDLWLACLAEAIHLWGIWGQIGADSESVDGVSAEWDKGAVCKEAANLLRRYVL